MFFKIWVMPDFFCGQTPLSLGKLGTPPLKEGEL